MEKAYGLFQRMKTALARYLTTCGLFRHPAAPASSARCSSGVLTTAAAESLPNRRKKEPFLRNRAIPVDLAAFLPGGTHFPV